MVIDSLALIIEIPGCASLKEKRGHLKPLLARLHRDFNLSAAEVDHLDHRSQAMIACVIVSNDSQHNQRVLQQAIQCVETHFPDLIIQQQRIERI